MGVVAALDGSRLLPKPVKAEIDKWLVGRIEAGRFNFGSVVALIQEDGETQGMALSQSHAVMGRVIQSLEPHLGWVAGEGSMMHGPGLLRAA